MEQVDLPAMSQGDWLIEHFALNGNEFQPWGCRHVPPGRYTRLTRNGVLVMTDTPDELNDHISIVQQATGSVLLNGLGLGMVVKNILLKEEVTDVTVIEISQDLIELIGPHYTDKRLSIICADAFEFKPPKNKRYNAVWHDIWDYICVDNLPEMHKLHRKYGQCSDWQGSWCRGLCEARRKKEQSTVWIFGG